MTTFSRISGLTVAAALSAGVAAAPALAYDGTNCKEPGVCWEAKPGYPDKSKLAGSKYDPKHDPKQVNKQSESIKQMEERNKKRADNFAKTGKFQYDVSKISN
jgi:methanol dehydrogenase (cytochrome c) subunit 2